jgi:hypothetical protein
MPRNNSDRNHGRDSRNDNKNDSRGSSKRRDRDRNSLDGFESEIDGQIEPPKTSDKKEG